MKEWILFYVVLAIVSSLGAFTIDTVSAKMTIRETESPSR